MESRNFTIPQLFALAGTRAALGIGVGLLLSDQLSSTMKKKVGWTLVGLGALSTIPFAIKILSRSNGKQLPAPVAKRLSRARKTIAHVH